MAIPKRVELAQPSEDPLGGAPELQLALFRDAPQGILVQDTQGRVVGANPAAERILGPALEQLRGSACQGPAWSTVHEDGSPFPGETHPSMAALRAGKPVEQVVMGVVNPAGAATTWIEVSAVPVFRAGAPRPCWVFSSFTDITERKRTERSLQASEEKFSKAFHASPDSINLNRLADGVYLAINEGFTRMTGYREAEVIGRSSLPEGLGLWVNAEDRRRLLDGLERDGFVRALEAPFRRKDGTLLTGLMSASRVELQGVPCALTITRDITALRLQSAKLEHLTRLYAALRQVSQAIVRIPAPEALFQRICEVMVRTGGFSLAWIGRNDAASSEVPVVSQYGDRTGFFEGLRVRSDDTPTGRGVVGTAIREGRTCMINDFRASPKGVPWLGPLAKAGLDGAASVPIRKGGAVWGALTVYVAEKQYFASQEIALLEEAGADLGFALANHELEEQRQRMKEDLQQSRANLSAIIESTSDLIWSVDQDFRIVACNAALTDHLHRSYGTAPVVGLPLELALPSHRAAVWASFYRRCLSEGPFSLEYALDGGRTLELGFHPITQERQVLGVTVFGKDVTARKRAEKALWESNQRLELALTSARLGIWELNLVDGTQIWNDRMFELYGLEPRAVHPDHAFWCRHIVHPDDLVATDACIQEALAGLRPYDFEYRVVRPDGTIRFIKSNGHILRDGEGNATRVIGVNRDRTAEVLAESERRRLQTELLHTEKLESLGSLAGGVAHDMNNVLAAIMGTASALTASFPGEDPRARQLDTITRACVRGRDVVRSLLYFARKDVESMGPVNLNSLASEMVHLLSHTTLKQIQISTDFQEPLGLIEGDAGALSHALVNLCVNAVDAMPQGGALAIQTRRKGPSVEIRIQDSGQGMSAEVARKAIEPFFTTKPVGKGTGLGLAMVYGTVKAHQGSFEIQSVPGQGTLVILGFPLLLAAPAGAEPPADGPASPASPVGSLRVLLVDDDDLIRASVGSMLKILGHQVRTAESGEEALAAFQDGLAVDLVILDMNMPGLNGAQTLSRLLALRPGQAVLLATGYSEEAIAPLLKGHPNVSSLQKPFSLDELRTTLRGRSSAY